MLNNTFFMHCGANVATRQEIAQVPTPKPEGIWHPVAHLDFIDQVERALQGVGYDITSQQFALWGEGKRLFGLMEIDSQSSGRSTAVGLRGSYDKSFALSLIFGSHLFVCDNLSFSGEVKLTRKNTTNAYRDLPNVVDRAVGRLTQHQVTETQRFQAYQTTEISRLEADHLIVELFRTRVAPASYMGNIINEWENPRHPEFREEGRTVWRLYNAVTESLKPSITQLPNRTMVLTAIMDSVCKFEPELNTIEGELA